MFWVIVLLCVILLLSDRGSVKSYLPYDPQDIGNFSDGWTTQNGKAASLTALHAEQSQAGEVVLQKSLPEKMADGTALNFRSKNVNFILTIGNRTIYDFRPDDRNLFGKSYGSCFHSISLSSQDAGKVLVVHAWPIYEDNSCFFHPMYIGSTGAFYRHFMGLHFGPFLLCVITMLMGIAMILLSFFFRNVQIVSFNLLSLGALVIILGCWSGTETMIPQLMIGRVSFFHSLNYLLLIMMPYPGMLFVNSLMAVPKKWLSVVSFVTVCAELVTCNILNAFNIADFHECLTLIHAVLLLTLITFGVLLYQNGKYCRSMGIHDTGRFMFRGFVLFGVFCLIDMFRYAFSERASEDTGYFIRIGLFLYTVVLFSYLISRLIAAMQVANEAEAIKKVAYTDALTGLPNRAAFLVREKELQKAVETGEMKKVLVCAFDLNHLKRANDTFGHAFGDHYLMTAANMLRNVFDQTGTCYRVGGDEFSAFIAAEPVEEKGRTIFVKLQEAMKEYNARADIRMPIGIACGFAVFEGGTDKTLEKTETEADRLMYRNKHAMKCAEAEKKDPLT